jgi:hypothetical protein
MWRLSKRIKLNGQCTEFVGRKDLQCACCVSSKQDVCRSVLLRIVKKEHHKFKTYSEVNYLQFLKHGETVVK